MMLPAAKSSESRPLGTQTAESESGALGDRVVGFLPYTSGLNSSCKRLAIKSLGCGTKGCLALSSRLPLQHWTLLDEQLI